MLLLFEIVVGGIFAMIPMVRTINPKLDSQATVEALENIINRFYIDLTSTIFIMEQSSLTVWNGLKPNEIAGEMMRIGSKQFFMAYVIENSIRTNIHLSYHRFFNIILVDSYDSFR